MYTLVLRDACGYVSRRRRFNTAVLFEKESSDIRTSLNFKLVGQGLLKIERKNLEELLTKAERIDLYELEREARGRGEFMWYENCGDDPEEEGMMGMKGISH